MQHVASFCSLFTPTHTFSHNCKYNIIWIKGRNWKLIPVHINHNFSNDNYQLNMREEKTGTSTTTERGHPHMWHFLGYLNRAIHCYF
jgi:hypothetical protein